MRPLEGALHPFRLELKAPLVTGKVSMRFRAGFLVALSADGITGWGEASPLPGWSQTSLLETEAALRSAIHELERSAEDALDSVLAAMHDTPHARAGIAGAWVDLQARRAERPLAEHLSAGTGSAAPPAMPQPPEHLSAGTDSAVACAVAVNALLAAPEPSEVERAARDAAAAGFKAVKLKVAALKPEADTARIRAARAGLGPSAELRLDANGAWDEATALDVLGRVHDCKIAYCEEPVPGIDAIAAVGRRSPVAVAADESIRSESDAARALNAGIGTLIVKPQALGGPDVAMFIADRAHRAGASVTVTSFLDSAVGLAHALHVAAAADSSGGRRAHGLATAGLLADDVADPPPIVRGAMRPSSSPGIGVVPTMWVAPTAGG